MQQMQLMLDSVNLTHCTLSTYSMTMAPSRLSDFHHVTECCCAHLNLLIGISDNPAYKEQSQFHSLLM